MTAAKKTVQNGGNANHPPKDSQIKVHPIKSLSDVKNIKKLLQDNPRNFCLFVFGINTALRASDLVEITVAQVKDVQAGDHIEVIERKTKRTKKTCKPRLITLNKTVVDATQALLASNSFKDTDTLFKGQRGALTVPSIHRLVKGWCRDIHLKGNFGSHTLRKTFGYHQRVTFKHDLPTLVDVFGHSTQKQTLEYLCIQDEDRRAVYMNEL